MIRYLAGAPALSGDVSALPKCSIFVPSELAPPTMLGKLISQNQITGEQGAALVKARAHAMGFLYTPYGPVEAGIDGIMELRDHGTGQIGGRLVAVQVKTRLDNPYTAETKDAFEYLCAPEDIAYWQQANVPVIIVLVRLSDSSAFWKHVRTPGVPIVEARRIRINKATDCFDVNAAAAIAQLTVDQAEPGIWLPPSTQPDDLLLNAVKAVLPSTIQTAPTPHRTWRDVLRALLDINDHPPFAWVARDGRIITFLDIEATILREVIDKGSVEVLPTEEFSLQDDENEQRLFVELLNRTLRAVSLSS